LQAENALLIPHLPALKILKIGWHQHARSLATYEPNTSIEVLVFRSITFTPPAFLKSLKSVRSMCVYWIGKDDFKKILENCSGLMKLEIGKARNMEEEDFEDIYKEVRSVKPSSVKSIEVKIEGQVPFVLKL
jgi:hypothetical protein